jgi:hypothetical protein
MNAQIEDRILTIITKRMNDAAAEQTLEELSPDHLIVVANTSDAVTTEEVNQGELLERMNQVRKILYAVWNGPNCGALKQLREAIAKVHPAYIKKTLDYTSRDVDELLNAHDALMQKRKKKNSESDKVTTARRESTRTSSKRRSYAEFNMDDDEWFDGIYKTKRTKSYEPSPKDDTNTFIVKALHRQQFQIKILKKQNELDKSQLDVLDAQVKVLLRILEENLVDE